MRGCLFANARPSVPFIFDGGAERTTFALVSGLARKGVAVIQVCTFPRGDIELGAANAASMGVTYFRKSGEADCFADGTIKIHTAQEHLLVRDGLLSVLAVHPSEFQSVTREVAAQRRLELLITWLKGSDHIVRLGSELNLPTVLRIVGPYSEEGYPRMGSDTYVLANSPVTARLASEHYEREVNFLPGVIDYASYVAEPREPRFITYINPRTEKGIHLFCKIAALLPESPFLVVRGWSRDKLLMDELQAVEFISSLPNVVLLSPVHDMRDVYSQTRILLLPSRWQESWARVIGEAQANGIPVVASNRGSSPQSVGEGGVILEYGDPGLWAEVIRMIYHDDELRARLGDYARRNVRRFDPETLLEAYLDFFSTCAQGGQAALRWPQRGKTRVFFGEKSLRGMPLLQPREIDMCAEFDLSEPAHR
jgi:glycosyltransferase involved in cell wall biosynthesis